VGRGGGSGGRARARRAGRLLHRRVVGYSIGGGVGWLARRYGLAANSILAADVVTAEAGWSAPTANTSPTAAAGKETAFCYLANRPSPGRLTKKVAMDLKKVAPDLVSCPIVGAQNAR
jgi:hypothetical protein